MAEPRTDGPLDVPAAWRGDELSQDDSWIDRWRPEEIGAFDALVEANPGLEIDRLTDLGPDQLSLPTLADRFGGWRRELFSGRGVLLIRGLPIGRWTDDEAALVYWAIGHGLGVPVVQNPAGDVLGHVTDTGRKDIDADVRLYQTPDRIRFHVDGASAVALLCLRSAHEGGASRLASSVTIHNEVWRRRPDLAAELFGRFPVDRRNEQGPGEQPFWMLPMARWDGRRLRTFYHSDYTHSSQRHSSAPRFTPAQQELLALVEEIGADPTISYDMDLEPGDIQIISNEVTLHARTAYVDRPGERRHLLRLWLDPRPEDDPAAPGDQEFSRLFS